MSYHLSSPIEFTILIFWLITFAVIAWRRLEWSVYITLFLLPAYLIRFKFYFPFFGIDGIPTTLLETHIYILFLGWLRHGAQGPSLISRTVLKTWFTLRGVKGIVYSPWFALGLILLGAVISTAVTPYKLKSLGALKAFFIDAGLFLIVLNYIRFKILDSPNQSKLGTGQARFPEPSRQVGRYGAGKILISLALSGFTVALISLGYFLVGNLTYDGRLRAFYESPNQLAMYLVPIFIFTGHLIFIAKSLFTRFFWGVAFSTMGIVLFLTYSRGAWLGLLGAFIFMALCSIPLRPAFRKAVFLFFIAVIFGAPVLLPILATAPVFSQSIDSIPASFANRIVIWKAAFEILKDHPFGGIGLGTFQDYYLAYQSRFSALYPEWAVPYPHNLFLAFWLQTGIIGLAGFLLLIVTFFKNDFQLFKKGRNSGLFTVFIAGALVSILGQGVVDTPIWKNDLAILFLLLLFILHRPQQAQKQQ